jgi:hypothetical protein
MVEQNELDLRNQFVEELAGNYGVEVGQEFISIVKPGCMLCHVMK